MQLLRITLPGGSRLFLEVSGSHHRCSLRFLRWHNVHSRPVQAKRGRLVRARNLRLNAMAREVACPRCGTRHEWEGNPFRPFCSERCKMIDFGSWLEERHAIPASQPKSRTTTA